MNIKEYISSGILEAYVLGELNDHERIEVEKNLAMYPELKAELDLIEETQEELILKAAVRPRPALRQQILEAIPAETKVVDINSRVISFWKFAAAASITVALITSYLAFSYHNRWRSSENNLADLIAQNQRIAQDYNHVNQRIDRMENDLRVMDDPSFKRVVMTGTPNSPEAMASVYWNQNTNEVYVSIQKMKTLARENQYQLWAIIDGKPVDAGMFDGGTPGLIRMKDIGKGAILFAVTIEPRGGKPSPTMETMQVKGDVKKS